MTTLITSDLHLNDLARDAYRHDWVQKILPTLLQKHNAESLIILGDLCDEKDRHGAWLVNQVVSYLQNISKMYPIIILKGNHDYADVDCPFYEFLGRLNNITWIGKPTTSTQIKSSLKRTLFLPHTHNYKRDWNGIDFEQFELILTHLTFKGAQVGPRKLDGIPTDIFPADAKIVSGDVHVPQSFGQVTYVGAPYMCDFGDKYKPRVLLLENGSCKSIASPGPQKRLLEIVLPNRRGDRWTEGIKCSANPGDILKIRVTIEPAQAPQWNTIKQEIQEWGRECGYVIYLIQPQIDNKNTSSMAKRQVSNKTDQELVAAYVGARAVSEATLKTGLKLMEKV